jgi:2-polyprenyl-3-methyl-5-hydroxy-6-metoxy-1,4-benzoquinol methylase
MTASELQHQVAERNAAIYEVGGPRIAKVRKVFSAIEGRIKVLDVGCADGSILAPFAQRHDLHGVDISEALVSKASRAGLRALVHDLETKALPYPDQSFDAVFNGENIEHCVNTDWMLSEINRVLKPGGTLVLTFPNIRTALSLMMMLLDLPPMYAARYRSPHYRDFTLRTMKIALRNNGFSIQRCLGSSFFLPKIGEFGSFLATYFPSWSNTAIVVGTKVQDAAYDPKQAMSEIY